MASPSAHGHMSFTPDLVRSKTLSHAEHAAAASLDDGDSSFGSIRRMDRLEMYDELWNEPPSPQVHRARTDGRAAQGKGAGLGGGFGEGRDGDGGGGQQPQQQTQLQGGIARTFSKQLFLSRIGTSKAARNSGKKESQHRRRPSVDSAGLEMPDKDTQDLSIGGGRGSGSTNSNSGGLMAPCPPAKEKDGRKGSPSKGLGSRRRLTSRSIGNINFSVPSWAKVPAVGSAPKSPTSECIVRQLPNSNSTGDSGGKSPRRLSLSMPAAQDVGRSSFLSGNISAFSCDPAAVAVALEEFQAGSSGNLRARVSPLRTKSPVNQRMATVEAIPRAELAGDFSFQSQSMPVEPQLSPLQQQQQEQQLSPQPQQQTSPHQQQQQQQQQQQHPPPKHRRRASMELPPLRDVRSAGGSPAAMARQLQKSPVRSASAVRYMSSFEEHRRRVAEAEKQERSELVVEDEDPAYAAAAAAAAAELAGAVGGGGIGGEASRAQGRGSSAAGRSRLHRRISSYTSGSAASAAVAAAGEDGADNCASGRSGPHSHRRSGSFGSGDGPGRLQPQQRLLPPQYQPSRLSASPPMDAGDVTPDGTGAGPEWPCAVGLPSSKSGGSADGDVCGGVSKMGSSSGGGGGSGSGVGRIPERPSTRRGQERQHQGSCGELDLDLMI